jgi:hypothetical protein
VLQGTSNSADSEELRTRSLQAGHDVAVQYRELLQTVLHILSRPGGAADAKQNLPPISRRIAQCVTELVTSAELLKGCVCCHCKTNVIRSFLIKNSVAVVHVRTVLSDHHLLLKLVPTFAAAQRIPIVVFSDF